MSLYLVTGGAASSVRTFRKSSCDADTVRVIDSLITGKRRNLDHLPGVEFVEGDVADFESCVRAAQGVDYVLHQAAIPSVPRSVKDPIASNRANIDGSINILVAARDAGVKRLVYAGSSSAYGDTPTLPKREDMPTAPLSPYALGWLSINVPDVHALIFETVRSAASTSSARVRIPARPIRG
jgi:nucleoside-diphosphate-sugar epimerase